MNETEATSEAKRVLEFHKVQAEFFSAIRSEKYSYLLYGGAIQGGKTTVALLSLILLCRIFPRSRWAVVRKDGPSLTRNTIPSFNIIRPQEFIAAPTGKGVARCSNGSEIIFFPESLDRDPDYDRWKGLMVNGFLLEEANELDRRTFDKAIERAGTWKCNGPRQPKPTVLLTCNPARNWVLTDFYIPWKRGTLTAPYYFQRALPDDNPHLTQAYRDSLKNLPPHLYKRFVMGDWDVLDDPSQLISFEWLLASLTVAKVPGPRQLGVDVARFGDDFTCLAERDGNALIGLERHHGLSTQEVGALTCARMNAGPIDAERVRIDSIGLGAGVVDYCRAEGFEVREFNASNKAPADAQFPLLRFKNKRAWAWWKLREAYRLGKICTELLDTSRLFQDLSAVRYKISGDKMVEIESKDQLKKRIGRSPDEGDAAVMAWAESTDETTIDLDFGSNGMGDGGRRDPVLGGSTYF